MLNIWIKLYFYVRGHSAVGGLTTCPRMHEVLTVRSCLVRTCVTVIQKWGTEVRQSDLSWPETTSATLMTSLILMLFLICTNVHVETWRCEHVRLQRDGSYTARGAWRPCSRRPGKRERAHSAVVSGYHRVIKQRHAWLRLSGD